MKNSKLGFIQHQKSGAGFTLVELLIVIAIIGILAAGLLIAINPIEQVNKGRDGAALAKAKDFIDACERWYAAYGTYPNSCGVLEPTELRSGFCTAATGGLPQLTLIVTGCSARFTARSTFYSTACSTTCDLPGETGLK